MDSFSSSHSAVHAYRVWEIKTLGKERDSEAKRVLELVAKQVQPIMRKRAWKVSLLSEFSPIQTSLLGINIGRGKEVRIRLRTAENMNSFFPFEHVLGTMLHELVHIEHGPHNANFYKLLDEITEECECNMAKGITGTGEGFDSKGYRLNPSKHNPLLSSVPDLAASAALKRFRSNEMMPCGPKKSGGDFHLMKLLLPSQAAAMAAERRFRDDTWCSMKDSALDESKVEGDGVLLVGRLKRKSQLESNDNKIVKQMKSTSVIQPSSIIEKRYNINKNNVNNDNNNNDNDRLSTINSSSCSQWICEVCTLLNQCEYLQCDACGVEKCLKSKDDFLPWICKTCTFENLNEAKSCVACDTCRVTIELSP